MKEYRIMAYFKTDVYGPRSFGRKIFRTREDAERSYPEAEEYYHNHTYNRHIERVVIESREVGEWKNDTEEETK